MVYLASIISIFALIFLLIAARAFYKNHDLFTLIHITKINNFYITPLLLFGIILSKFSLIAFAKIFTLILLNLIITNLICRLVIKMEKNK
ncbi:MAG: hypothetical protein SFV53_06550 [Rickettsiales bacterium]|nr:hypothetical protein [Rickettsiales bacterium]